MDRIDKSRKQPHGLVRINERHWLANDIIFAHSGLQAFAFGRPIEAVAEPLASVIKLNGTGHDGLNGTAGWAGDDVNAVDWTLPVAGISMPLTLSAWWVANTSTGALSSIVTVRRALGTDGGWSLDRNSSAGRPARVRSTATAATGSNANATVGSTANQWTHGCAVISSSTSRIIYADAGNSASTSASVTPPTDCNVISIGRDTFTAGGVAVDDIVGIALPMVIARALDASEVLRLYEEQRRDPWALFAERRVWMPVMTAAAAFNPAWARGANTVLGVRAL